MPHPPFQTGIRGGPARWGIERKSASVRNLVRLALYFAHHCIPTRLGEILFEFVAALLDSHDATALRLSGQDTKPVEDVMQPAFPFVDISTPVELLVSMIHPENPAVLVRDFKTEKTFIITRSDIMRVLM